MTEIIAPNKPSITQDAVLETLHAMADDPAMNVDGFRECVTRFLNNLYVGRQEKPGAADAGIQAVIILAPSPHSAY